MTPDSLNGTATSVDGERVFVTTQVERLGISVAIDDQVQETRGYAWRPWQEVEWRERPKAGLAALADVISELNGLAP